jgi:hypothetical protein
MRTLTRSEISLFMKMEDSVVGVPVRFLHEGCAVNVITGEKSSKGSNIIHHMVYWNFPKEVSWEIAHLTGTKPVFDRED